MQRARWLSILRPRPRKRQLLVDTHAVTPVIGTVMILLVASIGTGAVLMWGLPNMEAEKSGAEYAGILDQFYSLDALAENTMHGGSAGKAAGGSLNIPSGYIQRSAGNWFVVSYYPENVHGGDVFRVEATGFEDIAVAGDTLSLWNRGADIQDATVILDTVWNTFHVIRSSDEFEIWKAGKEFPIYIGDPGEFNSYPTRVRVLDTQTNDPLAVVWFYPMGALEYTRETAFGPMEVILENGAVLTTQSGGTGLREKPLLSQELDANDHLTFMALFLMLFVDDPSRPGISAGGAGNYPLYFSLKSNNLRLNGTEVYEAGLDIVGPRARTWADLLEQNYGFWRDVDSAPEDVERLRICRLTPSYDAPPPYPTSRVCPEGPVDDTFKFVLMESLMQISLFIEGDDISTRPPPPPPGGNDPDPTPPGSSGGECSGTKVKDAVECVGSGWGNGCGGQDTCKLE